MAAPKKLSPEAELEIIRRRTAGERIQPIARDFGIAHQTVSKLVKRHAQLAKQQDEHSQGTPGTLAVRADQDCQQTKARPQALPSPFSSYEERMAYYESRMLETHGDWLNYRDAVRGHETPGERRLREQQARLR